MPRPACCGQDERGLTRLLPRRGLLSNRPGKTAAWDRLIDEVNAMVR